jgi:hypothetical protein
MQTSFGWKVASMGNAELIELIRVADVLALPLERRSEGDDTALVQLMDRLGLKQTVVDKMLIIGELLREALHRNLYLPRRN